MQAHPLGSLQPGVKKWSAPGSHPASSRPSHVVDDLNGEPAGVTLQVRSGEGARTYRAIEMPTAPITMERGWLELVEANGLRGRRPEFREYGVFSADDMPGSPR